MLADLLGAFGYIFSPVPFLWVLLGTTLGIFVGAVPGLTGGMLIALSIPLTFTMNSTHALVLMVSMYVGSVSGGLISATLLKMPGTPSSVMTTFDGFPMAARGEAERALALSIGASLVGGLVAGVFLVVLSVPLSRWATTFGPFEYFAMVLMALVLIASISQGSMVKGLLAGALGIAFALPGLNPSDGQLRLTFGWHELDGGFALLPVLLGVFVMSQIIVDAFDIEKNATPIKVGGASLLLSGRTWRQHGTNLLRSSVIGTWIGILPGVGASISSMVAYATARSMSKTPEAFGTGSEEGIVASEAANNANVGGALIPLITMGIPGSPIDAILLGALILHNIQPGPLLFVNNGDFVWALVAAYLLANVLMFAIMTVSVRWLARLMLIDRALMLPAIFVACVVGCYALHNRIFDVWVMLFFGLVGFAMARCRVPLGPFVIGFVLAGILEEELRSGMQLTADGFWAILDRPIALAFLAVSALTLVWPFAQSALSKSRNRRAKETLS
ncbi:tripartite tricarboxylate transporter permease [Acuticoccus mangrovi]|uniref:Tripartite tricarboxylate transporter permease n=1 Tax=Acuticoccus mangrovi TaxID=2796142 RepID=A0A934MJK4_9HYPH|nr:tripartite tricarboxylate transporter permease [Acuticoccus mangrovi]MBJ3774644.1 tripartite tricarboxylate transporter permease [Acuticoccus mangrovi]